MQVNEAGNLIFNVATQNVALEFETKSALIPHRWHYVTFSLNSLNLEIAVNGIADSSFKFPSTSSFSIIRKQIRFEANQRKILSNSSRASGLELFRTLSEMTKLIENKGKAQVDSGLKSNPTNISSDNNGTRKFPSYLQVTLGKSSIFESARMTVDMMRVSDVFHSKEELRALAAREGLPFAGEEIEIGCFECTFSMAAAACRKGFHICTQQEIFGFAYQVARVNGWDRFSRLMWSYSRVTDQMINSEVRKLGLCCVDSDFEG